MPNQFIVPQFIDVEDKIIGPITTKQFIMGVIIMLFMFLAFRFADTVLFVIEALFLLIFYILSAFVKINGQPFYYFVLNVIRSAKRPALRSWSRETVVWQVVPAHADAHVLAAAPLIRKKLVDQQLSSLSLLVDTGGKYRPEEILLRNQRTEELKNQGTKEQKN